MERRKYQRIGCILEATRETGELQRFAPDMLVRVLNISPGGISMHSGENFGVGTTLTMRIKSGAREVGPIEVQIRHATEQPNGTWIMGGEFSSELDDAVVQFILAD